jgi:MFS family permease
MIAYNGFGLDHNSVIPPTFSSIRYSTEQTQGFGTYLGCLKKDYHLSRPPAQSVGRHIRSFVKRTFGWNYFGAGLIFLAIIIPGFISPVFGYLSDKHGPKWLSVLGYLACAPPLILPRLVDHNSTPAEGFARGNACACGCLLDVLRGKFMTHLRCFIFRLANVRKIPLWVEIIRCVEEKMKLNPGKFGKNGSFGLVYRGSSIYSTCAASGGSAGSQA